jgi:hypothetical protein
LTGDFKAHIHSAQRHLAEAQHALAEEISSYPTPISGCDSQFNHLLSERARVANALRSLYAEIFVPTPRTPMRSSGVESR